MSKKEEAFLKHKEQPAEKKHSRVSVKQESKNLEPLESLIAKEGALLERSKGALINMADKLKNRGFLNRALLLSAVLYCSVLSSTLAKKAFAEDRGAEETKKIYEKEPDRRYEIKSQIYSMQKYIGLAKRLGYSVNISKGIDAELFGKEEFHILEKKIKGLDRDIKENAFRGIKDIEDIVSLNEWVESPLSWLNNYRMDIPKKLKKENLNNTEIYLSPLSIESKKIREEEIEITLYNWFKPDAPIVYSKRISKTDLKHSGWEIQLRNIIRKEMEEWQKYQEMADNLQTTEYKEKNLPQIDFMDGISFSNEERNNIQSLAEKIDSIEVNVFPKKEFLDEKTKITASLSNEELRKLEHPIKINNPIVEIVISIERVPVVTENETTINGQDKINIYTDTYGNVITERFDHYINEKEDKNGVTHQSLVKGVARKEISILPPLALARESKDSESNALLNIDIPSLATIDIKGLFILTKEKPFAFDEKYKKHIFYTNVRDTKAIEVFKEKIPHIVRGIERAENLFGIKDKLVENIYILDTSDKNAYFDPKDPNTIVIHDEILNEENPESISDLCFHETVHQIDNRYKISDDNEFQKVYNKAKQEFFAMREVKTEIQKLFGIIPVRSKVLKTETKIFNMTELLAEENFLPEAFGGHPWENSKEFLASFLNTFNHPNWKKGMEKSWFLESEGMYNLYIETLETLKKRLQNTKEVSRDDLIFKEIEEKLSYLK